MIAIIDYGIGNLGSHLNMLKKIGFRDAKITSDVNEIKSASKLILPGVGSFDNGMKNLNESGLAKIIKEKVLEQNTSIIGICLGMQLMSKQSEEGILPGLGLFDAKVVKFNFNENVEKLKIPHMGWNLVKIEKHSSLFDGMLDQKNRFYFVHSYHLVTENNEDILTTTFHGYKFVSSVQKSNIIGVQFHPEKSHKFGIKFYKNLMEL